MTRKASPKQRYTQWALSYPVPEFSKSSTSVYYAPFETAFYRTTKPLPLEQLQTNRLVPATRPAQVQLALDDHRESGGGATMVWCPSQSYGSGALIDSYETAGLWGSTSFSAREGREGTTFATTRDVLIENALASQYIPCLNQLKRVQQLPGMQAIVPVWLPQSSHEHDTLIPQRDAIGGVSDRAPYLVLNGLPPEWLVTLLSADRRMVAHYPSNDLPTVAQVLRMWLTHASLFEQCHDPAHWMDEDLPYEVCEMYAVKLKHLLGDATYTDLLHGVRGEDSYPRCTTVCNELSKT